MRFYPNLFVSEEVSSRFEQIVEAIKLNKMTPNIYIISLASNPSNLLDIIPSWELLQPAYPKQNLEIIGIAEGKKNAFALVEHIITSAYEQTGHFDLKAYLEKVQEGQI